MKTKYGHIFDTKKLLKIDGRPLPGALFKLPAMPVVCD
jgi:hypothetical protein